MNDVIAIIQAVVRDQLRAFKTADLATVKKVHSHESSSDKKNYECDVKLRDSGLELKRVPICTGRVGAVAIPNVDDLVLVQFICGDIQSAVITGRLHNDVDRSPQAKPRECVYISPDSAESGVRRMYLEFPNGNKILLDDDKLEIEIGKTKLTLNHDGDVVLDSEAKLNITTKGDTSISAQGNLDLSATGDVKVQGNNVTIQGKAQASLEGSAGANIKGGNIKIAGMVNFSAA